MDGILDITELAQEGSRPSDTRNWPGLLTARHGWVVKCVPRSLNGLKSWMLNRRSDNSRSMIF